MVYITKSAGGSYPITGKVSLSREDLGQGGQKSNELGRKYRELSTERLFSSVPFVLFGVFLWVLCGPGRQTMSRCTN